MILKIKDHPTYKERIKAGDIRKRRRSNLGSFILFLGYNLSCFFSCIICLFRYPFLYRNIDKDFLKYKEAFGFWELTGNWEKVLERVFFKKISIESPSIEIGLYKGNISSRHFEGKTFDFGSEYVYQAAIQASKNYTLWKSLYCDELNAMAVKDETFNTMCLVHVIDHVKDISVALDEIRRVMKLGGKLYFSGLSQFNFRPSILNQLLGIVSPKKADKFTTMLAERRKMFNRLTPDEWEDVLRRHGFKLIEFQYVGSHGFYPYLRYFLHYVFSSNGCFELSFYKRGIWREIFKKLFGFYFVVIGYPPYKCMKSNKHLWGADFFLSAVKIN